MNHRFFVAPECILDNQVAFTEDQRKQMRSVLRLNPGAIVYILDNTGREYVTEVRTLDEVKAEGSILEVRVPATEPTTRLTLIQSMPKGEKLDFILQKCTEIGVAEFLIIETERTIAKVPPQKVQARLPRWRAIVREAAEQSGRARLPVVEGVLSLHEALARVRQSPAMIAWEEERATGILAALRHLEDPDELAVFIGPEGGFTADEVIQAKSAGVIPVSLGPRKLRTETAAVAASALVILGREAGVA